MAEGSDLHEEYQGAWKVAINQGVVLRLKLHYRKTDVTIQLMYSGSPNQRQSHGCSFEMRTMTMLQIRKG